MREREREKGQISRHITQKPMRLDSNVDWVESESVKCNFDTVL